MNHIKGNTFINCNRESMSPLEAAVAERDRYQEECGRLKTTIDALGEQLHTLTKERDEWMWNAQAYAGALGYPMPGTHTGKLIDGTTPQCGMCNSQYRKDEESHLHALESAVKVAVEDLESLTFQTSISARVIATLKPLIKGGSK